MRVFLAVPLMSLIAFPRLFPHHNAQEGIDPQEPELVSRHLAFWNGFQDKLDNLEAYALQHTEDAGAHYRYGMLCLKGLHTADKAQDAFKKAISLKRDFAEAYNGLGWAYFDPWGIRAALMRSIPKDDVRRAERAFRRAIELKSEYSDAYLGLGCAHMLIGHYTNALKYLQNVVALDPNNDEACEVLSQTYEASAQYEKAIDARLQGMRFRSDTSTESAINCNHHLSGHNRDGYFDLINLGRLYEKAKQYNAAIQVYAQAVEREPDAPEGYHHLGLAYFSKGDKESAFVQLGRLQSICQRAEPEKACDHYAEDLLQRIHE
jgi:tetratricopeptide (TPR) repeat protein